MSKCPLQRNATMEVQRRHVQRWRKEGTCSYCGSLHPDVFMQALKDGAILEPTTKGYKAYLGGKEAPSVRGACKFYYEHLSDEQQTEFIRMLNAKEIKMHYNFTVLPFFIQVAKS